MLLSSGNCQLLLLHLGKLAIDAGSLDYTVVCNLDQLSRFFLFGLAWRDVFSPWLAFWSDPECFAPGTTRRRTMV
jgi:hypothetical protein